jgi:hypothetical protein
MTGETHKFIANMALACLDIKKRYILYPRWGGIESGAVLSDEFRILWEIEEVGSKKKQLVHRGYVDSDDPKDHGGVTRAFDHSVGSISFINDNLADGLEGYTEEEFFENLGMFLGVASHHIADLCTPVHVGSKIDFKKAGFKSMSMLHSKLEHDIQRLTLQANIKLTRPKSVRLSKKYFWDIAQETYDKHFVQLETLYKKNNQDRLLNMVSDVISSGIRHTRDVWHTVLTKTNMTKRKWSFQPLI